MASRPVPPPDIAADGKPAGKRFTCKGCGLLVILQLKAGATRLMHEAPECDEFRGLLADVKREIGEPSRTEIILTESEE